MSGVSEAYGNGKSWQLRLEIVSILTPKISLKLTQLFIEDLTTRENSAAHSQARKYDISSIVVTTKVLRRFDDHQIVHFADFILSSRVYIDMPFGEKVLNRSFGIGLLVPNTIRNMRIACIIEQYLPCCKEMCSDFEPLGNSILFTILETCKASAEKSS